MDKSDNIVDESDNIEEIANNIFNYPPKDPNSIQLQFEEMTADFAKNEGYEKFLFNILFLITFRGMEMLYGHRDILALNKKQFDKLNMYVNSYGYELKVNANGTSENLWDVIEKHGYIKNYQISFEKYNIY